MQQDAQFLHILNAESEHLITVSIALAPGDYKELHDMMLNAIKSDGFSDNVSAWNHQRALIIQEALEKHLLPVGVKFVREWLREEVEDNLATKCATVLEQVERVFTYQTSSLPFASVLKWRHTNLQTLRKEMCLTYSQCRGEKVIHRKTPFMLFSWTTLVTFASMLASTILWILPIDSISAISFRVANRM